jgi:gas vesicle protein
MAIHVTDRKLLAGFLIGAGVGATAALLLEPKLRARLRKLLVDGAYDVAAGIDALRHGADSWHNRKDDRNNKALQKRLDRMRTAGL